jgi:hypothetical protein
MSCPSNPPAPTGYGVWLGRVPQPLTDWAISIRDHIAAPPYGTTWSKDYGGQTVIARKDYHTWTNRGGQLVTGICLPGVTLYSPRAKNGLVGVSDPSGDPLAMPDAAMAIYNAENADGGIAWGPVVGSGLALLVVVGGFVAAIKYAGRK